MPKIRYNVPSNLKEATVTQAQAEEIMKEAYQKTTSVFVKIGTELVNVSYIHSIEEWESSP